MATQETVGVSIVTPNQQSLPQIPNQSLLVNGSKIPPSPAFNTVSTGSPASDRRATIVRPRPMRVHTLKTTPANAIGRLPQTGEAVGFSVILGLALLLVLVLRGLAHHRTE